MEEDIQKVTADKEERIISLPQDHIFVFGSLPEIKSGASLGILKYEY